MQRRIVAAWSAAALGVGIFTACVGDSTTPAPDTSEGGTGGNEAGSSVDGGNGPTDSGGNNAIDTGTTADAGPAACDPTKPFNAPSTATLTALNVTRSMVPMLSQFSPRLSADELTIFYSEYPGTVGPDIAPSSDILSSTRAALGDSFLTGSPVLSVDTQDIEQDPSLTADGLSIFYTVGNMGKNKCLGGNFCIAQAFRGSPSAGFTDAGFVVNNPGANQQMPYVVGSGPVFYYALSSPSTAGFDITSNQGTGTFVNVNGPYAETSPVVSPDELTLYFASNRSSDGGAESDIYVATRKKKTDAFDPPTRVDALSSPSDESPGYISTDGCRMYMTRDDGAVGGQNLYFASKGK